MIAVEVPETYRAAQSLFNFVNRDVADVSLDRGVAPARKAVTRAMRMKEIEQSFVRPVERVDAERMLSRRQSQRHRDEEAALERADLGDVAVDPEFALAADNVPADRRGEARGHAAHRVVALGDIAIDGRIAGAKRHAAS